MSAKMPRFNVLAPGPLIHAVVIFVDRAVAGKPALFFDGLDKMFFICGFFYKIPPVRLIKTYIGIFEHVAAYAKRY